MNDKSKVLQEENHAVSSAFSEGQSSEFTEQEGVTPKNPDICTCETESTQDRDKFPEPSMKRQKFKHVSVDSVIQLDGGSSIIVLRIESLFTGEIRYEKVNYENFTVETLRKCVTRNGGTTYNWKILHEELIHVVTGCRSNGLPIICGHTELGWIKRTDGLAFYHQDVISSNNQSSKYMGEMDIQPKGSLENIVGMINEWILSTPEWSPLEAIISFSVASVVLPFAQCAWGKTMNNPVLHLNGISFSENCKNANPQTIENKGFAGSPFSERVLTLRNICGTIRA